MCKVSEKHLLETVSGLQDIVHITVSVDRATRIVRDAQLKINYLELSMLPAEDVM